MPDITRNGMTLIKIKEFPEKQWLEVKDDDVLLIEDENNTCQITVRGLRGALLGNESLQSIKQLVSDVLDDRINQIEDLYPLRILELRPLLQTELSAEDAPYGVNQNSIDYVMTRENIHLYKVSLKENTEASTIVEYVHNGIPGKWIALHVEFNRESWYIGYDTKRSSGDWAESYSLDNDNPVYDISASIDGLRTSGSKNGINLWVDMSDLTQDFCFVDETGNYIHLVFDFTLLTEKEDPEPPKTYTIYQPDEKDDTTITVEDNGGVRIFRIAYHNDIEYTFKDETNELPQSGNWVKIKITPPAGHVLPTYIAIDGVEITFANLSGKLVTNEDRENPGDYDYKIVPHGETEDTDYYIDMYIRFVRKDQLHICTFRWGTDYLDTVMLTINDILYPPIDPEEPGPDVPGTDIPDTEGPGTDTPGTGNPDQGNPDQGNPDTGGTEQPDIPNTDPPDSGEGNEGGDGSGDNTPGTDSGGDIIGDGEEEIM